MKINGIRTDEYSKKINLEKYLFMLIYGFINKYDLTDIAYKNNISRSELSKLNNYRSFTILEGIFTVFINKFIKAHRYNIYHDYIDRLYNTIAIDSTFIETLIKGSGIYQREKRKQGIKIHLIALTNMKLPLKSIITPANVHDTKLFDALLNNINKYIFDNTILTFDLGYYDLNRFKRLKENNINFVSRIKKNANYKIIKEETFNSKIIEFNNGLILRLVTLYIDNKKREYITDIMDLPEIYIYYIYSKRWVIEKIFENMKSILNIKHLISKNINGVINQIFATLIAYIVLLIIQSLLNIYKSIAELVRSIKNDIELNINENYLNKFNKI